MGKRTAIFILLIAFLPLVSAEEPEVNHYDVSGVEGGEVFNVQIFVTCKSYEANYTVRVVKDSRFDFIAEASDMEISGNNAEIEYDGVAGETLDFKFPMTAQNDTSGGDYEIPYQVFWMGAETGFDEELVRSDVVTVTVRSETGESPCSSSGLVILPLFLFGAGCCYARKKRGGILWNQK